MRAYFPLANYFFKGSTLNSTCPLKFGSEGLTLKEEGMSSSRQTSKKKKKESAWTQICFRPRNRGDYCDSARIPSPPHPSQVQPHSEHTLLRQTPEFQRHFIELLRLLTSTAKYCRGISKLCRGHWKLSVVGNLWGERVRWEEEEEEKRPSYEIKVVQVLGNRMRIEWSLLQDEKCERRLDLSLFWYISKLRNVHKHARSVKNIISPIVQDAKQDRKKLLGLNIYTFAFFGLQFVTFGNGSVVEKEREKKKKGKYVNRTQ